MTDEFKTGSTTDEPKQEGTPLGQFIYHQRRAVEEGVKAVNALIPPDFRRHSAEARKEWLKSFEVLITGAQSAVERELNRMRKRTDSDGDGGSGPSTTGKTKVKVEVS